MTKIITGKYKGRVIPTNSKADYRPSTSKFREAVFSILTSGKYAPDDVIENSNILDMFSGSGALGFEALSRGAKSVTMLDVNRDYLKISQEFAKKIGISDDEIKFICASALNLPKSKKEFNIVFMDPPYGKDFVAKSLKNLVKNNWLLDNSLIIIESEYGCDFALDDHYEEILKRDYGKSILTILKYIAKNE